MRIIIANNIIDNKIHQVVRKYFRRITANWYEGIKTII